MLGNREDAEEAVQDIFLKVHRGLGSFRGESGVRTWLYRITVNTCLTRLRNRKIEHLFPESIDSGGWDGPDTFASLEKNPEEQLIERDNSEMMLKAIDRISPDEKEVLILLHVDGLKYEEIAEALDVPIGTVCARIHRARKSLRKSMDALQNELRE